MISENNESLEILDTLLIYIRLINIKDIITCTYLDTKEDIVNFCEEYSINIITSQYTTPFDLEIAYFNKTHKKLICMCNHLLIERDNKRLRNNVLFYLLSYLKDLNHP